MKTLLVTGGFGFLGRNVAKRFYAEGYEVIGIGHGCLSEKERDFFGYKQWTESDITLKALIQLSVVPDVILHAGGSGSVAHSFVEPYLDFQKSVESTAGVLEFMRTKAPQAKLIYPSSPAVHGVHAETPIKVNDFVEPVSPYGAHKLMAENLCAVYRKNFGISVSVIRFFSIYGEGLKKQLLWDASQKFLSTDQNIEFWGSGKDTRDFLHIEDAAELILKTAQHSSMIPVLNGGSGIGKTVSETLYELKACLNSDKKISFKGEQKQGDPHYYVADLTESRLLGWTPKIKFQDGLKRYSEWFLKEYRS